MEDTTVVEKLEVAFTKDQETKNTIRYQEDSDNPKVGTFYLKKGAAASLDNPETLKVTVEKA